MTDDQLFQLISKLELIFDKLKSEQRRRVYMADITKCKDSVCPMKNTCYRFMADENDKWQSYFAQSPKNEDGTCSMYWSDGSKILIEQLKKIVDNGDKV